jgi:ABC-type transport system involved in Fe-S cluster assembly fused permease/ATPase subunit
MPTTIHSALAGLHYASAGAVPGIVLLATLITINASHTPDRRSTHHKSLSSPAQVLIISTYIFETIIVVLGNGDAFGADNAHLVHLLLSVLTWATLYGFNITTRTSLIAIGGVTLCLELPLAILSAISNTWTSSEIVAFVTQIIREVSVVVVVLMVLRRRKFESAKDGEHQPLFDEQEHVNGSYGGTTATVKAKDGSVSDGADSDSDDADEDEDDEDVVLIKQRRAELLKERGGWLGYLRDFKIFAPYVVPKDDYKVQLCYLACILCLVAGRALNVLIPAQLGKVADSLSAGEPPYRALAIWLLLSLAAHQPGLQLIETLAKIPIENYSYRGLTNAAFGHVMDLSMDFHSERDSAEVIRAIEQGHAITSLLSTLVLDIVPTSLDLVIALIYLSHKFNQFVAIALLAATVIFTAAEVLATSWNLNNRRSMAKASRQEAKVILQAVQGWQTVSFFNMFRYERHRFGQAVQDQLAAKQKWSIGDAMVQAVVESLFPATFFVLACLVVHEIYTGRATPGDFVFLMQYWENLTWPISMLSHNCRFLMSDLVDAERLLHLLQIQPSIKDHENAVNISVEGRIEFEHVTFGYESKQTTIHNLSLAVSPGQTMALVGETGAGKSSIMKLLLRLYDINTGRIMIDGHDIRDITLDSLRTAIGVVPQAPLLFNGTILENLRYARLDSTDADIEEACQAAAIHEKILTFADGYGTKVGEQGVKLSGGEIQRLAIARVFLKDPPILILDEATSSVDSLTEAAVQLALDRLRNGRTTLVIAHRLSTIVKADQILVIHDGSILEQGKHDELLLKGGRYHRMWTSQTSAEGN